MRGIEDHLRILTNVDVADRVAYFQVNVKENGGEPLDIAAVQELIEGYT
jgi:hypothetical protein